MHTQTRASISSDEVLLSVYATLYYMFDAQLSLQHQLAAQSTQCIICRKKKFCRQDRVPHTEGITW